jgi:hypothetical protein
LRCLAKALDTSPSLQVPSDATRFEQLREAFEEARILSTRLLDAASVGDWDALPELERTRSEALTRVEALGYAGLSIGQRANVAAMLRDCIDVNDRAAAMIHERMQALEQIVRAHPPGNGDGPIPDSAG